MATIFPLNPQINDEYNNYRYVGNGVWDVIGLNFTADYAEILEGKISASVVPDAFATVNYVDTEISNIDALPVQSGNAGKFLTTSGSAASWADVDLTEYLTATINEPISVTDATDSTSSSTGAVVVSGGVGIGKDLWVEGDLYVSGTTQSTYSSTVSTRDNLIYLNEASPATITNAVGDGQFVTYTAENDFEPGMAIRITGVSPSAYNISTSDLLTIYSSSSTQFVVQKSTTDSYISGGLAYAKVSSNPDLGFAGGYYDSSYAHAGLFRDATDGVFKFFKGYTPEPDASVNIDTNHASFALAPISAASASFTGNIVSHIEIYTPAMTQNAYTLVGADDGRLIMLDNSTNAGTLYIPTDATYNFAIGTQINIVQKGTGQFTIAAATPGTTTLSYTPGNKLRAQWSAATLIKIANDTWLLLGDLLL